MGALTLWFWVWLILTWVVLTIAAENDSPGLGTLAIIALVAVLQWFVGVPVLQWVWVHPLYTLGLVGCYFVCGVAWSFGKWSFYVAGEAERYAVIRDDFLRRNSLPPGSVPESLRPTFIEHLTKLFGPGYLSYLKPSPSDHRERITTWIGLWPFSLGWMLLNDPVRWTCQAIYRHVASTLQAISDYWFLDIEKELRVEQKPGAVDKAP